MMARTSHAPDEFDRAAQHRAVDGAHRAPRRSRGLLATVAVIVLAPLAAWALFTFGLRSGVIPDPADALSRLQGQATPTEQPTTHGPATTDAPEGVDRTAEVTLLDGTTSGQAGERVQAFLEEHGYVSVRTSVYSSGSPTYTTVFVRTAQETGIATEVAQLVTEALTEIHGAPAEQAVVVESAAAASSAPIVVVLRD